MTNENKVKHSEVAISTSMQIPQLNSNLVEATGGLAAGHSTLQASITAQTSTIGFLNGEVSAQHRDITTLQQEIKSKDIEVSSAKHSLSSLINQLGKLKQAYESSLAVSISTSEELREGITATSSSLSAALISNAQLSASLVKDIGYLNITLTERNDFEAKTLQLTADLAVQNQENEALIAENAKLSNAVAKANDEALGVTHALASTQALAEQLRNNYTAALLIIQQEANIVNAEISTLSSLATDSTESSKIGTIEHDTYGMGVEHSYANPQEHVDL